MSDTVTHVSYRYLLVELPLRDGGGYSADLSAGVIQGDISEFLWEEPRLGDTPRVTQVYPGDVVPGGEPE